ncbi:MAG TPA: YihY/virulence factor BrkB family protein [Pyrinomonadaceae bacterium]|nr:YihY/virulence factor BrkB family protein [Pyrinomonadaceae bacterium]
MASLWKLGGLGWRDLAKRVWTEIQADNVFGRAAELSYYFLLALFPFLIFLTSIIGFVLGSGTGTRHALFDYLGRIMPPSAFQLISNTMYEVSESTGGGKLSFGILAALWAASNGLSAITESLNDAYDLEETRPWWKQRLTAIGLTIALSIFIIGALILVVAGGRIAEWLAAHYGFGPVFPLGWKIIQWPVVLACMTFAFALIYYVAPDFRKQSWQWLTPGSVIGVALWLLVSLGFRVYLHYFNSYNATYGSLGAVIILMLWLYFTGAAVLIGGEVNSEIENAAAKQGDPEAKEKGEKAPDEKNGAVQAA